MPSLTHTLGATLACRRSHTLGATLRLTRGVSHTMGALLARRLQHTYGATICQPLGSFRGTMTEAERDALVPYEADVVVNTDTQTTDVYDPSGVWVEREPLAVTGDAGAKQLLSPERALFGPSWADIPAWARAFTPSALGPEALENMSRFQGAGMSQAQLTSQVLSLTPFWFPEGYLVSALAFLNASGLTCTPTNWWFALYDSAYNLLANSADQTTTTWPQDSDPRCLAMTTPYEIPTTGIYYPGVMVKAGANLPSLLGLSMLAIARLVAPNLGGASSSGLSWPPPDPCAAPTPAVNSIYWCIAS